MYPLPSIRLIIFPRFSSVCSFFFVVELFLAQLLFFGLHLRLSETRGMVPDRHM
eukprot:m.268017 g.268017  ORF g.268017 m.268017 type:complete len:54 (-) comp16253_c1_seq10:3140-3301(-)